MSQQLGEAAEATKTMIARAQDLARLEQALRPPKARGGFGELLLENLLRDRLPPNAYELQYTFPTGERVDAVIRAADRLLPIDAKFPLDNFERIVSAENDAERQLHEKAFARDVKGHIDAIAAKYIRPDFGTFELAFMYLPAEAIHYEVVAGKTGALLSYAHERRVFPVSATTFSAYLQMIVLGLRGLQIEQTAQDVMKQSRASKSTSPVFATISKSSANTSRTRRASTPRPRSGSTASRRNSSGPPTSSSRPRHLRPPRFHARSTPRS